jgi:tryptophan synthase alpha chain
VSRIAAAFAAAASAQRAAFVPYLTAGDPDLGRLPDLLRAMTRGGADVIEIGVPFSDPIADGVVNQRAAERGRRGGATLRAILDGCARLGSEPLPPLVLFTYFNPIHRLGEEAFAARAAAAGIAGVLVTDLPPEEGEDLRAALEARGIDAIGLVAPTSSPERRRAIAAVSRGFLYFISRAGVTGARDDLPPDLETQVRATRRDGSGLPIAVGFGLSRPEQVRAVRAFADGFVVGSALVRLIEEQGNDPGLPQALERACRSFREAA